MLIPVITRHSREGGNPWVGGPRCRALDSRFRGNDEAKLVALP